MKVKQGDSSISPAAYAAACEALEGSRRPKAIHLSPYEDLIKGIITTQTVLNLCYLMMKILCVIHIFTCIWILVGNLENR